MFIEIGWVRCSVVSDFTLSEVIPPLTPAKGGGCHPRITGDRSVWSTPVLPTPQYTASPHQNGHCVFDIPTTFRDDIVRPTSFQKYSIMRHPGPTHLEPICLSVANDHIRFNDQISNAYYHTFRMDMCSAVRWEFGAASRSKSRSGVGVAVSNSAAQSAEFGP